MNVFELEAVIRLATDKYKNDLSNAEKDTQDSGSRIGNILGTVAKVGAAALGAAATATIALTKKVVDAYGEYEQLVGGVDKLYGDASAKVQQYAKNSYQTVGISANQYMETATSFSAALINSLNGDVDKAAELTDVAMRSMSDNWNTFGTDIESVQSAYQGFAKQNYTMLDNLKLGYGGTKTEMERLIADANEYGRTLGMTSELSIDSFADIVQAIDLVQQKQHIAGTTAKESATTIQGSINTMKGAWQDFLVALGGGGDVSEALDKVVDSFGIVVDNIIPIIQKIADALPQALTQLAKRLPALMKSILPAFTQAVMALFDGLLSNLGEILDIVLNIAIKLVEHIIKNLPKIITRVFTAIQKIVESIASQLPKLIPQIVKAIVQIIPAIFRGITETVLSAVSGLVRGVTGEIDAFGVEARRIMQETNDRIKDTVESWQELKAQESESVQAANQEAGQLHSLWEELKSITDENGNVKEGMENRASFIVGTLNDALGTEIELEGTLVKGINEESEAIENLIAKKRAQTILAAQEEAYNEAYSKRSQLYADIITKQEQLASMGASDIGTKEWQAITIQLQDMEATYNSYLDTIAGYEYAYGEFQQGNYENMQSNIDAYGNFFSSNLEERRKELIKSIEFEMDTYDRYNEKYGDKEEKQYKTQVEYSQRKIEQWERELSTINQTIDDNHDLMIKTAREKGAEFALDGLTTSSTYKFNMLDPLGTLPSDVRGITEDAGTQANEGFKQTADPQGSMEWYKQGFMSKVVDVGFALLGIGQTLGAQIREGANNALGEHSPSKEAMKTLMYYAQGYAIQSKKEVKNLYAIGSQLGTMLNDGFNDATNDFAFDSDLNGNIKVQTDETSSQQMMMQNTLSNISNRMDYMEDMLYNAVARVLSDGLDLRWDDRELTRLVRDHA